MAYDRFDRDERSRWSDDRFGRSRDERGFWNRASDEVASWFGDDDAERRRRQDSRMSEGDRHWQHERENAQNRDSSYGRGNDQDRDRTFYGSGRTDRDFDRNRAAGRSYRPMSGDYGRSSYESDQFFAASGYGRGERSAGDYGRDYSRSEPSHGPDFSRRTGFSGSRLGDDRDFDPQYRSWRDRHMGDLDRDYDDYRRENQSRFEDDFTSWRQKRNHKRGLLSHIREHMEMVGDDDKHVGTVDRIAGDRIILTKADPESGGVHHSLSCSDVDRIEGDKVILDCSADEARNRWRDESRDRALFEREDQGEMGPRNLNRSFEGTYR